MLKRFASFLALGLLSCSAVVASDVTLAQVQEMETRWKSRAITTYSFTPEIHSFGARRDPKVRVYVPRSRVKTIRFLGGYGTYSVGSVISASRLQRLAPFPLSIDEAFERIKGCILANAPLLFADFDPASGVPLSWACGELETDGWWGVSLRNLELGTPPGTRVQRSGSP